MTVEEFQNATAEELREKANDCFTRAESTGSGDWAGLYLKAEFYLREIERREHKKERDEDHYVSRRDLKLELVVIVLIGVEIVLSTIAIRAGSREADKQFTALNSLNQSTATTANNIANLTQTQKNTLDAMQNQLEILRQDQKQRLAEMTTQPVLRLHSQVRQKITTTDARYEIILENSSNVAAREFNISYAPDRPGVGLEGSVSYIPVLGPRLKQTILLTAKYPAGTSPFHVQIICTGQNIAPTKFELLVKPPAR